MIVNTNMLVVVRQFRHDVRDSLAKFLNVVLFVATIAGVLFNFKTTGYWVFDCSDNRLIIRFVITYVIVYMVSVVCMRVMSLIGVSLYYGGALLILPMAALGYILNKRFVFNK